MCVCLSVYIYLYFPERKRGARLLLPGFWARIEFPAPLGSWLRAAEPPGKFLKMELPPIYEFQYWVTNQINPSQKTTILSLCVNISWQTIHDATKNFLLFSGLKGQCHKSVPTLNVTKMSFYNSERYIRNNWYRLHQLNVVNDGGERQKICEYLNDSDQKSNMFLDFMKGSSKKNKRYMQ
jgi:hypothetical protein